MERIQPTAYAGSSAIPFAAFYDQKSCIYGERAHLRRMRRKRRLQARRRRICLLAALLALFFLLGLSLTGFARICAVKAPAYKYYTAVTVCRGDTLWDIACRHKGEEYPSLKAYMKEIKEINNMKSDAVYYGQKLILPYYSSDLK